jgi:ABC-2 type transport system ATP-binding protein
VSFDWTQTDNNGLLRSVMEAGGIVSAFREERRHLNDAFMDLTERGVR